MTSARQAAPVQSVCKAMDLLDRVIFAPPGQRPTLTQLAGEMGLRPNTAHNLLKSLETCGYLGRDGEGGRYVPGYKLGQVGLLNRALSPATLAEIQLALTELAERVGELVLYAVLSGHRRVTLAYADGAPEAELHRAPDPAPPIYAVPTGRVLLACAPRAQRDEIIEAIGLPERGQWPDARTRRRLDAALEDIARQGRCVQAPDAGRHASFAVVVPDRAGQAAGALGCMAGQSHWPPARHEEMFSILTAAAPRLGALL